MKRKVVKQGAATMMVSLPAKWAKAHQISKGSEVEITYFEEQLLISAQPSDERKKSTTINLSANSETLIRTLITNVYRKGYDQVTVNFSSADQFHLLQDIVRSRLLGYDIISKSTKHCVIENITEPSSDQFDNIIQKLFLSIKELLQALQEGSLDAAYYQEISSRIQRYDNFLKRTLSKYPLDHQWSTFYWSLFTLLVHASRELYYGSKVLTKKKSKAVTTLTEEVFSLFTALHTAYLKKDPKYIASVHELQQHIVYDLGYKLLQQAEPKQRILVYHLITCTRMLYQANSPLVGILV